jgi:hypothetical protein
MRIGLLLQEKNVDLRKICGFKEKEAQERGGGGTYEKHWKSSSHNITKIGFGGLGVACWPLVPKFAGSNPAEAVGFLGWKILSTPSFGGEVKLSAPCRRSAAYKRSINLGGSRNLGKITGQICRPQFHLSLLGSLASLWTYRHLAAKVGTSKGGGKQWQTAPKNLPRMQCARAIPVIWLGSGSCQPGL